MVIGKIKPTATLVAQFAAGVEVEAIQHEGKMFLPVVGMGEFAPTEDEKPSRTKTDSPAPAKKSEPAPSDDSDMKIYTKDELMDMESKDLIKILKNEFDINPDDYDGKNTNKKLRDLILDAQKEADKKPAPKEDAKVAKGKKDPEPEDAPSGDEGDTDVTEEVAKILEDFDAGKKNKKKTISAISALSEDADSDKIAELVEEFEEDGDADLDEMAEKIAKVLKGDEEKPKPRSKRTPAKSAKEELVEPEDLEVGDRVSVYWAGDYKEWFKGEVKEINKKGITIYYDDDTEDVLDEELHTKIKRLAK